MNRAKTAAGMSDGCGRSTSVVHGSVELLIGAVPDGGSAGGTAAVRGESTVD